MAVAAVGWWRVASMRGDLDRARFEASVERENVSHLTDEFERTRDGLLEVEHALVQAGRHAREAASDTRAMQDCVDIVSDEDEAGPRSVVFGFLKPGEGRQVFIDEAEWYVGDDAKRAAREDQAVEVQLDYYIGNDDPSLTSIAVARDAVVVTTTAGNIPGPECKTWSQFVAAFKDPATGEASFERSPYWLTVRNEKVVRLIEQYLP